MLKRCYQKQLLEAGCDEAGRGCLAGPVFAAVVILPKEFKSELKYMKKVNDSKQLSDEVRRELRPIIETVALAYSVASVDQDKIDEINILNASFLAMHFAIKKLILEPELLLIDGNRFKQYISNSGRVISHQCIIQGDEKFLSIACASILAKTYRDDYMNELHEKHPEYCWNRNKGYGTKAHRFAIQQHGPNEHHRMSFALLPSHSESNIYTE